MPRGTTCPDPAPRHRGGGRSEGRRGHSTFDSRRADSLDEYLKRRSHRSERTKTKEERMIKRKQEVQMIIKRSLLCLGMWRRNIHILMIKMPRRMKKAATVTTIVTVICFVMTVSVNRKKQRQQKSRLTRILLRVARSRQPRSHTSLSVLIPSGEDLD